MSTEPSALTKAIHHGTGGAVSPSSNMCQRIEKAIREEFVVIDKADLPEVTVDSDTYLHADQWRRHPNEDPNHIRRTAIALLAIAAHIESAQSAESVAAEKLTTRRDELAREFWHQEGVDRYDQLYTAAQLAVDHIIGLESPA